MKLYIIYGSETLLLKPLIKQISCARESFCVRIYNNKIPTKINNFFDLKYNNFFTKQFEKTIQKLPKKIEEIIFIGAASIMQQSLFWSEKKDVIDKAIDVNIKNYLFLIHRILKMMMSIKFGRFIYLSSFRSIKPTKGTVIYSSCKAFGETFFKGIGLEYGSFNITTHVIRMGAFDGKMLHELGDDYEDKISKKISLKRPGTAEELCNTINFCINNPYQNSGIIELNGGLNIDL
jgi:NADP-dependent 3-hydroxy acid dehydrogenase YdfG